MLTGNIAKAQSLTRSLETKEKTPAANGSKLAGKYFLSICMENLRFLIAKLHLLSFAQNFQNLKIPCST